MITIDDRQAIEDVIREFLEAAALGNVHARLWAGPVAEWFALNQDVIESTPFPLHVKGGNDRLQKLEIRSIEGDSAEVTLKADCFLTIDHPIAGQRHTTVRYRGDAVLRRESNSWRIITLQLDGVDLASALFDPVPAEAIVEEVHIAAAARFTKGPLLLLVAVRNLGDSPAVLGRIFAGGRVWWLFDEGAVLRQRPLVLRAGANWGIAVSLKASLLRRSMTIRVRVNNQDVALDLHPPPRALWRRIRQSAHTNAVLHVFALCSLLAIPLAGPRGIGGFALLLLGAGILNVFGEALGFLSGTRVSAQALYGAVGLLEIAVAAFLLQRGHVDKILAVGVLAVVAPYIWFQFRTLLLRRRVEQAEIVRDRTPKVADG